MYDNVRKPESDWYEAGYAAPRTDTTGTGCYDSYWSPSQAAAPKKKPHQGLKITMIILGVLYSSSRPAMCSPAAAGIPSPSTAIRASTAA